MQFARRWCCPLLFIAAMLNAAVARADDTTAPVTEETWQVMEIAGARVGYGHVSMSRRKGDDGQELIVTDVFNNLTIKRFDTAFVMTIR
ncbi:MAG: hypothetical protein JNG89_05890, partial [Planctomycetaceae bacterium]|nr:hypothetical protein [Planctomycetaceae bacterium]